MNYDRCDRISLVVARFYGVKLSELRSGKRCKSLTWPRHVAQYFCRMRSHASYPEIGRMFGGRDHSSITYGVRAVQRAIDSCPIPHAEIEAIGKRLDAEGITVPEPQMLVVHDEGERHAAE